MNQKFIGIEKVVILIEFWIVYLTKCGLYIQWNVIKVAPYIHIDPLKADQSFNIKIILTKFANVFKSSNDAPVKFYHHYWLDSVSIW